MLDRTQLIDEGEWRRKVGGAEEERGRKRERQSVCEGEGEREREGHKQAPRGNAVSAARRRAVGRPPSTRSSSSSCSASLSLSLIVSLSLPTLASLTPHPPTLSSPKYRIMTQFSQALRARETVAMATAPVPIGRPTDPTALAVCRRLLRCALAVAANVASGGCSNHSEAALREAGVITDLASCGGRRGGGGRGTNLGTAISAECVWCQCF